MPELIELLQGYYGHLMLYAGRHHVQIQLYHGNWIVTFQHGDRTNPDQLYLGGDWQEATKVAFKKLREYQPPA
jgi:hypothetical protein